MAQMVKIEGKNFEFVDADGDWFEGCITLEEKNKGKVIQKVIQIREKGQDKEFSGGWIPVKDLEDREWIESFVREWE